ncbi:MAG: flagellar basal body rod protein FlgC [Mangrovicoccus sp.]|nr:flagellar basal body rod protein FlgC [Mangrovicoccus sp.]
MSDLMNSLAVSSSGMRAQASRLRHVAENIANADTPGYRRKMVQFEAAQGPGSVPGQVRPGAVFLDQSTLPLLHDPSHPMADENGNYLGSNVNLTLEFADGRQAQRTYEANLKMFDQARKMSGAVLELLKR